MRSISNSPSDRHRRSARARRLLVGALVCVLLGVIADPGFAQTMPTLTGGPGVPPTPFETNNATPTFTFTSDESPLECSLDQAEFAICTSPFTPVAPLPDGGHSFQVIACPDNCSDPAYVGFLIDTVAPDTTIDSGPSGVTSDSTPTFGFSSDDLEPNYQCRFDGAPFTPCTSPLTPRRSPLSDGPHTFEVRAVDSAGSPDPSPAGRAFTVDTAAPEYDDRLGPERCHGRPDPHVLVQLDRRQSRASSAASTPPPSPHAPRPSPSRLAIERGSATPSRCVPIDLAGNPWPRPPAPASRWTFRLPSGSRARQDRRRRRAERQGVRCRGGRVARARVCRCRGSRGSASCG